MLSQTVSCHIGSQNNTMYQSSVCMHDAPPGCLIFLQAWGEIDSVAFKSSTSQLKPCLTAHAIWIRL